MRFVLIRMVTHRKGAGTGMFEFGRELRRIFNTQDRIGTDPSLFELFNLEMLIAHGRALDIDAGRVSTKDPFPLYLEASEVWSEYARRTGDPIALKRAATSAEHAGRAAKSVAQATQAALAQTITCLYTLDLYNSLELLDSAEKLLDQCRPTLSSNGHLKTQFHATEAMFLARKATRSAIDGDLEMALTAMAHIDRAIEDADHRVKAHNTSRLRLEAAKIRFERADLLILIATDRADHTIFAAIIKEFKALLLRLDYSAEPVTYAGVALRLAQALILQGQIEGKADCVNEAITLLSTDEAANAFDHAPLDYIAHKQALGLGLLVLSEVTAKDELFDQALSLYDLAIKKLPQKGLALRNELYNQRLTLLVRRAETAGDIKALSGVENQLKAEIKALNPANEPVFWAILQVNLARLYIVRGDLSGIMFERNEAIYALSAAQDIFEEQAQSAFLSQTKALLGRLTA